MTPEGAILKTIEEGLRLSGALVFRMRNVPVPIRLGKKIVALRHAEPSTLGMADLLVVFPPEGEHVWIEVKQPGKYQRPDQKRFAEKIEKAGGKYIVARSWEDVVGSLFHEMMRQKRIKVR